MPRPKGRLIPAAAYYRMSSDKQETSIRDQRIAVEEYAREHGFQIVREYVDEGISGDATEKRKGFQEMHHDACNGGGFEVILCWDQDRFGRFSPHEASFWTWPLAQAGIRLVTTDKGPIDWSDFTEWLTFSVNQHGKHQFLRDLSRNTLRGKMEGAKRGDWMGKPPFGYRVKKKRLVLGPESEVETVRRVFREYLGGMSLRGICISLNDDGIKSATGGEFSANVIRKILGNVTYTGLYVWNHRRGGKYHSVVGGEIRRAKQPGLNDEDDCFVLENNHPAIVDVETFERVQARLAARKTSTTPHRNGGEYLFTRLVHCGRCGAKMHGRMIDGLIRYYCTRYDHARTCEPNAVGQDELLDVVIGAIEEQFSNPETVARFRDRLRKFLEEENGKPDLDTLKTMLAEAEQKLCKAKRRLVEVEDDLLDDVQDQVRYLRSQRDRIEASLREAGTPQARLLSEKGYLFDRVIKAVSSLRDRVKRADSLHKRETVQQWVERIEVISEPEMWGRRKVYRLKRGTLHLNASTFAELSPSWTRNSRSTRRR